jgi:outer membrane protein OmpA-like peptidoglycan-associated protein
MMWRWLPLAILLLLGACAGLPASVVVLTADDDGHVGRVTVRNPAGQVELQRSLEATGLTAGAPPGRTFVAKQADVDASFAAAIAATPRRPAVFILYFGSDAADVGPESLPTLASAIAAAKAEPNVDISVVGNTDAAGTDAFNMDLSLRRAQTVRDALVAAGIAANVIEVTYDGPNNPLVPMAPGAHEPRNRRVEVVVR